MNTAPPSVTAQLVYTNLVNCVITETLLMTPGCESLRLLTELQAIGDDGTIFVPFVGSMSVVGLTTKAAGTKINEALARLFTLQTAIEVRARRELD